MTSTNIFNGFAGEKNSSRVLKPPGGGHTNIFAAGEEPPIRKDHGRNASSILEGKSMESGAPAKTTPVQETSNPPPVAAPAATAPASAAPAPQAAPKAETGSRGRVPPGGYSSGPLW